MGKTLSKKIKGKENLLTNTEKLTDSGIKFDVFNNGLHLKGAKFQPFDFWPSTGVWIVGPERGVGVDALIQKIKGTVLPTIKRVKITRVED